MLTSLLIGLVTFLVLEQSVFSSTQTRLNVPTWLLSAPLIHHILSPVIMALTPGLLSQKSLLCSVLWEMESVQGVLTEVGHCGAAETKTLTAADMLEFTHLLYTPNTCFKIFFLSFSLNLVFLCLCFSYVDQMWQMFPQSANTGRWAGIPAADPQHGVCHQQWFCWSWPPAPTETHVSADPSVPSRLVKQSEASSEFYSTAAMIEAPSVCFRVWNSSAHLQPTLRKNKLHLHFTNTLFMHNSLSHRGSFRAAAAWISQWYISVKFKMKLIMNSCKILLRGHKMDDKFLSKELFRRTTH